MFSLSLKSRLYAIGLLTILNTLLLLEIKFEFFFSSKSTVMLGFVFSFISLYLIAVLFRSILKIEKSFNTLQNNSKKSYGIGRNLNMAANQVASSSSQQAAAIEETSASLIQINQSVAKNSEDARNARAIADQVLQSSVDGQELMKSLVRSMTDITASAKKIEEIMVVIDDIAFQINLLALNASVEAARAGEQGKGFAVVAEAVRNLAHKSSESAKQISNLINESIDNVNKGSVAVAKSSEFVNKISSQASQVLDLNSNIAEAGVEQASRVHQIGLAVEDLEKATTDNSSVAENASQYAKDSLAQAEELMRLIDVLEKTFWGNKKSESIQSSELDFDGAVEAHLKWKARLANFIDGSGEKLSSQVVCKDDQCVLGKWIHGQGEKHKSKMEYLNLRQSHASFHKSAGKVVEMVEKGKPKQAKELIAEGSEFDRFTNLTVGAIYELRKVVEK